MGLFKRKARMPEFVLRDGEWVFTATFIVDNWDWLAATAWKGYLSAGRGFVMVQEHDDEFEYIGAAAPAVQLMFRGSMVNGLRRDCSRYNPEREFVLVVPGALDEKAHQSGKVESFSAVVKPRWKDMLAPPKAYELAYAQAQAARTREH